VWIGAHVIILPGVRIGSHSAIGAGSVVTKDVPANCLAAGNPARVFRQIAGSPP
jgi:acetyltransferase-like isoleucine patch superfamily enzyme